ncbi:replicative DNA helicase [Planctomycetota bacterium]
MIAVDPIECAPAHSLEAERCLLGALFWDNLVLDEVEALLSPADFYMQAHRDIYVAMRDLIRSGRAADPITTAHQLEDRKLLEEVGGLAYVRMCMEEVVSANNARHYAQIVVDRAVKRRVQEAGRDFMKAALEPTVESGSAMAQRFAAAAASIAEDVVQPERPWLETLEDTFRLAAEGGCPAWKTSLRSLHEAVVPEFRAGEAVIVAARQGHGKTSFLRSVVRDLGTQGHCAIFTLEETPNFFNSGMISGEGLAMNPQSGLVKSRVLSGNWTADQRDLALKAKERLASELSLSLIHDVRDLSGIVAHTRRLARRHELICVCVDYIQRVQTPRPRGVTRNEQVGETMRTLADLAHDLEIVLFVGCQLARPQDRNASPGRMRPKIHELRDSGELEQHADLVLSIHNWHECRQPPAPWSFGIVECWSLKQRAGRSGACALLGLDGSRVYEPGGRIPFERLQEYRRKALRNSQ